MVQFIISKLSTVTVLTPTLFVISNVGYLIFLQQYPQQGIIVKLREREGQRVDLGRSPKGHLWMVDGGWWYTFP